MDYKKIRISMMSVSVQGRECRDPLLTSDFVNIRHNVDRPADAIIVEQSSSFACD
jgi:hypothetical protein